MDKNEFRSIVSPEMRKRIKRYLIIGGCITTVVITTGVIIYIINNTAYGYGKYLSLTNTSKYNYWRYSTDRMDISERDTYGTVSDLGEKLPRDVHWIHKYPKASY